MAHALRRIWRRFLSHAGSRDVEVVYHPTYGVPIPVLDYDAERATRILAFLSDEGLLRLRNVATPDPTSLRALRRVHTDGYLESLQEDEAWVAILGSAISPRQQADLLDLQLAMSGGTILAARLARRRGVAAHLGGGLHHARAGQGHGYCVFNDVAVAIADLRSHGFDGPVLVVDLDLHDGEGTREIFADDTTVHTLSIHNRDLDVAPDALESTSVALGSGVDDRTYLDALRVTLPPVFERVRPRLVFFLAGCDPAGDDALGDWSLSAAGLLERDRLVQSLARERDRPVPLVTLLAGGYGRHAWRYSARYLSGLLNGGQQIEPPLTFELTLSRFRRLASRLHASELTRDPTDRWTLSDEDILGPLQSPAAPTRFLGYYTHHGLELLLEQYGLMDRLRARGFSKLRVELGLASGAGDTARVFSAEVPEEPLIEIRLRRDARTLPGMDLLCVEWLMLQDPRTTFHPARPSLLPGQHHPGLGLLREVVAMLVVGCERVGIDGIVFSPSRYHLARSPRRFARFLDPEVEARYRAISKPLQGIALAEASHAVETGRVVDGETGERVGWSPTPMVIPVSDRLRAWVTRPDYEEAVVAHAPPVPYRLVSASD
jgi:acetoin utilization deacetylase AcuC-like enzyme